MRQSPLQVSLEMDDWEPNECIVTKYTYGPDMWNVDNVAPPWGTAKALMDSDWQDSIDMGLIDHKDVPMSAYSPVVLSISLEGEGVDQMVQYIAKIGCITLKEKPNHEDTYVPVYLN